MITWTEEAWSQYLYWQQTDKKILKRIHELLKDIKRQPFTGIGDPEPLRYNLSGYWSRRINLEDRLVYSADNNAIIIVQCRYHSTN